MPTTTGTVTKCTSKPNRGFTVHVVGPPPGDIVFTTDVDADDYATALAAYTKGSTVDVTGAPPTCTGVTAR